MGNNEPWYRTRLYRDGHLLTVKVAEGKKGPTILDAIAVGDSPDRQKSIRMCILAALSAARHQTKERTA